MKLRIHEIWELPLLRKKIYKVQAELKAGQEECFLDENGNLARMIEMISPISYHQAEEIAGFWGMGYEQCSLNEDELETLDWALKMKMERLLEELRGHIKLRRGFAFSLAYDPDGNFGLILYQTGRKSIGNEKPPPQLETSYLVSRPRNWPRSQCEPC
jgi:hypothetical protein